MARFKVIFCPICQCNEFTSFLTCTDHFVSQEEFQIKQCNECGFKITDNIEDEDTIGSYYQSEEYISHSNTSKGVVNSIYHLVRKYMLGRKRNLVNRISGLKQGHILDIGAGTGFFLNEMKASGWNITGIEKSGDAREFARSEFDIDLSSTEELSKLEEKNFDVITLWHVLEHIHRLNETMNEFHRLLKNNGKLVIAVPNPDSYDARHYKEFWAAYDVPRHIWHFSPVQMKQLAKKHGFLFKSLHAMPFDSFYVSMLSEKYKKSTFSLMKGVIYGKISWIVSLFKKSRCSSLIYVFEKV
jgi:2-polyprenyl-3-methyl-5-hydroxy-6-metoxy-1,4-benzoquinol methylase